MAWPKRSSSLALASVWRFCMEITPDTEDLPLDCRWPLEDAKSNVFDLRSKYGPKTRFRFALGTSLTTRPSSRSAA
eukprot:883448-Pleurochrysis_carterae.AAC.1